MQGYVDAWGGNDGDRMVVVAGNVGEELLGEDTGRAVRVPELTRVPVFGEEVHGEWCSFERAIVIVVLFEGSLGAGLQGLEALGVGFLFGLELLEELESVGGELERFIVDVHIGHSFMEIPKWNLFGAFWFRKVW